MKSETSESEQRGPEAEPEGHANDVSIELQQTLAVAKQQRDQLQEQLDAEREGRDQLVESARILASYAQRLDETLDGILRSKRMRVGNYLGNQFQNTIPAAIKPYLLNLAGKLFRFVSKFVPEGQLADLDVDVIQFRSKVTEACNLLRRSDRLLTEIRESDSSGSPSGIRIGNPLELQISDELLLQRLREYQQSDRKRTERVAVYTAITNNYDVLRIPEVMNPEWDYVCFTDRQEVPGDHPWTFRHFEYIHSDDMRTARYVKFHPHRYFPDHRFSIWIDANVLIKSDFLASFTREFMQKDGLFAAIPHPFRSCAYDEGAECVRQEKDDAGVIQEQLDRYRLEGFPARAGLIEAQILLRQHNHERVRKVNDDWWREVDRGSRRDQISLMNVLRKNEMKWIPLITNGLSTRNHEGFRLFKHGVESDHRKIGFQIPSFLPKSFATDQRPFWMADHPPFDRDSTKPFEKDRIDIVICVRNALADVRKCLESVSRARLSTHRIIIIDDASRRATRDYLDKFSHTHDGVTLVRNPHRIGYTKSANSGMKLSDAPFVILLNSDTVVRSRWALKMLQASKSGPEIGVVGPMSNAASWQSLPFQRDPKTGRMATNRIPDDMTVDDMDRLCEQHGWLGQFPRVPLINGFCYGIKREVLDTIGYFDEEAFPIGYNEEDDFSMRALDAGFVHAIATHCYVFHAKSRSFGQRARRRFTDAGGKMLRERHGKKRIRRACDTMVKQPQLQRLRMEIGKACGVEVNEEMRSRLSLPSGCKEQADPIAVS